MRTPAFQEGHPSIQELRGLLARVKSVKNNEGAAILMIRLMLAFGDLADLWRLPRITGRRFEYPVDGGRIDVLLFHADDTVTIVEAKADGTTRDVAAGIGQLCYYASVLPERLKNNHRPIRSARRLLCSTLPPERAAMVLEACQLAGVQYGHLAGYDDLAERIAHLRHAELVG